MKSAVRPSILCLLLISIVVAGQAVEAAEYTPGDFHNYTHASGDVPENVYQYSIYVPKDNDPNQSYPLVFYLHGGGNIYPAGLAGVICRSQRVERQDGRPISRRWFSL